MYWDEVAIKFGRLMIWLLEYTFKLFACLTGIAILGTEGSFSTKLSAGFSSLTSSLRTLTELPAKISETITVITDYNMVAESEFVRLHGEQAVGELLAGFNTIAEYALLFYRNLVYSPLETIGAVIIGFTSYYLLARILRFYRVKGKDSFLVRIEKKLAEKVFPTPRLNNNRSAAAGSSEVKSSVPKEKPQQKRKYRKTKIPIKKARPISE